MSVLVAWIGMLVPPALTAQTGCCNIGTNTCQGNTDAMACANAGGTFFLDGTCGTLDPNRCVPANEQHACCDITISGADMCKFAADTDCINAGGKPVLGTCGTLDPNRCVPTNEVQTCCDITVNGADMCKFAADSDCINAGGTSVFLGTCGTLDPNRCVPANSALGCCALPGSCANAVAAADWSNAGGTPVSGGTCGVDCFPLPTFTPTQTVTATPTATPTATNTRFPNGAACASPSDCNSAFCVEGVCCNAACTGPLERCNLPGQVGTCTSASAPAPALTSRALGLALAVLGALAAVALRRRAGSGVGS
ncbi:MAG TPA: hypothetical protein VL049_24180 [Candidatus Dormibacteraeota bacterium]|nr:hypothetical protein [Candidatus Dormibacteraeota bacterium]